MRARENKRAPNPKADKLYGATQVVTIDDIVIEHLGFGNYLVNGHKVKGRGAADLLAAQMVAAQEGADVYIGDPDDPESEDA
jgi:hypothetical protein